MDSGLGKTLRESDTLREGMARSLTLMGTHPDRVKNVGDAGYVPTRVLSSALSADKGWQIWASLRDELAVLPSFVLAQESSEPEGPEPQAEVCNRVPVRVGADSGD